MKLVDNNGSDLDEGLAARLVARLDANLDARLDSILDSILDSDSVTGTGTAGGSNFRSDLGYVGDVDRELILGRDLDLDFDLDCFCSDPRVIASLGIEDMERIFNLPPVENPGYHL